MSRIVYATPEPPADIVRRLRQVDERLDLRWVSYRNTDYANVNENAYWAIVLNWAENDKRWMYVQRGEMSPESTFDIIAMLPPDCDVEQAFGFFQRGLRGRVQTKNDVDLIVSRVHKWNEDVRAEAMKGTMELAEELIETNAGTLFREEGKTTTKVYQSLPSGRKKT
jgi:hypothetical protein